MSGFNPRAHEGRDSATIFRPLSPRSFNPRAHEGRDTDITSTYQDWLFQPTRPRGARLVLFKRATTETLVSTHAPTRGATVLFKRATTETLVSTHAPTRGATYGLYPSANRWCFNPRAHEGRDPVNPGVNHVLSVSTHAPTRGATFNEVIYCCQVGVSTHAPTRGATLVTIIL